MAAETTTWFITLLSRWLILPCIALVLNSQVCLAEFYSKSQNKIIEKTLSLAEKQKWTDAELLAHKFSDSTLINLIYWLKLYQNSNDDSFINIRSFLQKHHNWPEQHILIQRAEQSITQNLDNQTIIEWFKKYPPKTCDGKKIYAYALSNKYGINNEDTIKAAKKAWHTASFSESEEVEFKHYFSLILSKDDNITRINNLLWSNKILQAERIIPSIDNEYQILFKTRIKLISLDDQAPQLINNLPNSMKNDQGLLYDLAMWYENKGYEEGLRQILIKIADTPQYHEKCWKIKARFIRDAIADNDYHTAYKLASSHNNKNHADYSDAEWLSGWIALRFLKQPNLALKHFLNFRQQVKLPVSISRADYWLGRTYEKLGDKEKAHEWYNKASIYQIHFYGQLAQLKLNNQAHIHINQIPIPTPKERKNYQNNTLVKAAYILSLSKKYYILAQKFIGKAAQQTSSPGEIALITGLGATINHHHLSIEATKHASYNKVFMLKHGYPIIKLPSSEVEPALVHSIIRQESLFNGNMVSSAGATGIMQIIPTTASMSCRELKMKFNHKKLFNKEYNTKLGIHHLHKVVKYYNGSYILAIAAYNAGEGNVNKWIKLFGDPRKYQKLDDIVDWTEKIKFSETRNYVHRVLESVQVYRKLHSNHKIMLESDLFR